jgi:hypothetical protein
MIRLAQNLNGCPAEFLPGWPDRTEYSHVELDEAFRQWRAWLYEKAMWFDWYTRHDDDLEGILEADDAGKRVISDRLRAKLDRFYYEVMADWGRHFGSLWD